MCNFMVQEYNRGAVIFGLPDPSGKKRPMVLLTDVKPNGTVNYGMTLNAFQISSQCYNKFAVPIQINWDNDSKRTCFIDTLYTLRFSQQELFASDIDFCGIISQELLDLCYRSLITYLSGSYKEIQKMSEEIREVRLEFLKKCAAAHFMDYRDTNGGIIRLYENGKEEEIVHPRTSFDGGAANNTADILGKTTFKSREKHQEQNWDKLTSPIIIPTAILQQITPESDGDIQQEFGDPAQDTQIHPVADGEEESADDSKHSGSSNKNQVSGSHRSTKRKKKLKGTKWIAGKQIQHQSTKALVEFLQTYDALPKKEVGEIYCIAINTAYNRQINVAKELSKRADSNLSKLSGEAMALIVKWGGGTPELNPEVAFSAMRCLPIYHTSHCVDGVVSLQLTYSIY